jgi:hypothetical protein
MKHIGLETQDESVRRFVLALSADTGGTVLEWQGRAVACVLPVVPEDGPNGSEWTEEKNARRSHLIDREIAGTLTPPEAEELTRLQHEMLQHRRRVAPLPIDDARALRQKLLAQAESSPADEP